MEEFEGKGKYLNALNTIKFYYNVQLSEACELS